MHVESGGPLRVMESELSEAGEGLTAAAHMLDWHGRGGRDILYTLYPNYFGAGIFLYKEDRTANGAVPVYQPVVRLAGLTGDYAFPLYSGDDHGFVIVSYGVPARQPMQEDDPGWLKLYRNHGTRGEPFFAGKAERIPVDNGSLADAIGGTALTVQPVVNERGLTDLIVGCVFEKEKYWPDGGTAWQDGEHPNLGYGRSYTSEGRWKGKSNPHRIFRLPNLGSNEAPRYGKPELLYEWMEATGLDPLDANLLDADGDGKDELVFHYDTDRLCYVKLSGGRVAGEPLPLLDGRLERGFFQTTLGQYDLDRDGELGILVTGNPGCIFWLDRRDGKWTEQPPLLKHGGDVRAETLSVPCLADLDGDGDLDMLIGDSSGYLWYYENTAAAGAFAYKAGRRLAAGGEIVHHVAGATGSIQGPSEVRFGYTTPLVMDWDGDGQPDIITNDICGRYTWYHPSPGVTPLTLAQPVPLLVDGKPLDGAWRARAAAWNQRTLALVNVDGYLQFYERDATDPQVVRAGELVRYIDGCAVRACGPGGWWGRTAFFACDWDGDGVQDLVVGTHMSLPVFFNVHFPRTSTVFWLRNVGSTANPRFERARLITLRDGTIIDLVCHNCTPWCVDLDGDGQLDLVSGAEDGKVYGWRRQDLKWDWDQATRFA